MVTPRELIDWCMGNTSRLTWELIGTNPDMYCRLLNSNDSPDAKLAYLKSYLLDDANNVAYECECSSAHRAMLNYGMSSWLDRAPADAAAIVSRFGKTVAAPAKKAPAKKSSQARNPSKPPARKPAAKGKPKTKGRR